MLSATMQRQLTAVQFPLPRYWATLVGAMPWRLGAVE